MSSWRSIDESPVRRVPRPRPKASASPPADRSLRWMELAAVWLTSILCHSVLGFFLVMCYFEIKKEPEQYHAVTIWRDAKGKDVLKIGAPEEGPPTKGADPIPEPPKKEEPVPPKAPPPPPEPAPAPAPPPVVEPAAKAPDPVPPPPKPEPEGGAPEPVAAAPGLGVGASAGVPKSDVPGAAKPSPGAADVTEADIDRDPTAAIRRRRAGTLTTLREGSQRDIVVVTGAYDTIQEVLDRLEIPYSIMDPDQLPKADLSRCKALLINCHNTYAGGLFRATDSATLQKEIEDCEEKEAALRKRVQAAKDKKKVFELGLELLKATSELSSLRQQLASFTGATAMVDNVRRFVESGGYVFSSDWGLTILERAFPGTVKNGGNIGPRKVTLRPRAGSKNPLLDEVFYSGPKTGTVASKKLAWEVDSGSYMIKVEKPSVVEVLVETGDVSRNSGVAVTISPEKSTGKVLHILSHFQRQATNQGDYALQNLLLNFLMERVKK